MPVQSGFSIESTLPTDERTATMTNAALGCYVKLMCFAWREGSIPADPAVLARLCGESPAAMVHHWRQVGPAFTESKTQAGRLVHLDLEGQRAAASAARTARSAAGALGAKKRWAGKDGAPVTPDGAGARSPTKPPTGPDSSPSAPAPLSGQENLFDAVIATEPQGPPACPQAEIIELFHQLLPANPRVLLWTGQRQAHLRTRWREMATTKSQQLGGGYSTVREGLAWWRAFFTHCAASKFLTGQVPGKEGRPPFMATLEWLVGPMNFAKLLEGQYNRDAK